MKDGVVWRLLRTTGLIWALVRLCASAEPKVPFCRKGHGAAVAHFGAQGYQMLVFGGKGHDWRIASKGTVFLSDLWALQMELDDDLDSVATFHWTQLKPPGAIPVSRWKMAMSGANSSRAVAVMGGDHHQSAKVNRNDTWFYWPALNRWQPLHAIGEQPKPRRAHIALETPSGLLVHGGKFSGKQCLADVRILTVEYDAQGISSDVAPSWRAGASFPDKCRWGAAAALLRIGEDTRLAQQGDRYAIEKAVGNGTATVMALFGGRRVRKDDAYHYYDDLWFYYLEEDRWELGNPDRGARPQARDHHSMNYVADTKTLYVFGGRLAESAEASSVLNDLWAIPLREVTVDGHVRVQAGSWQRIEAASSIPQSRFLHTGSVWYGPNGTSDGALVIFGGEHIKKSGGNPKLNDAWLYLPSKQIWTVISVNGCNAGDDGYPRGLSISMSLFEAFAAVILVAGISWLVCQQWAHRREYSPIEDEDEEF
uniref:Uncharacterized protein n=1 Tax=Pinguiococcus pyrenoidosus TaxID=172671 RepID=A0A7R9U2Q6_9STRA